MTKKQENPINTLEMLEPGMSATITEVGGDGALRQHFLDMGLIPGSVDALELEMRGGTCIHDQVRSHGRSHGASYQRL